MGIIAIVSSGSFVILFQTQLTNSDETHLSSLLNGDSLCFDSFDEESVDICYSLDELKTYRCSIPILEHLAQYSNWLDSDFTGVFYIEWPSLPTNISEKDYDACVEFLKSVRLPLEQENESLQVTDSLKIPNAERDAKLAAGYKLYPGVGWVHQDDLGNQQPIYRDNPNNPGELILDLDAMIEKYDLDLEIQDATSSYVQEIIPSDPVLAKKITESNNQFTLDFYKQVSKEKNENIFFSSPSISTAFSILYEGARGDTAAEIQDVFGFPTDDNERQVGFISFINMMNQKNNDENTIQMSNALWLANGFTPLPEYINTAITYYDSSIDTVNFTTDEGRLEINDWVKSKTQDRIEELLVPGSITSSTKMVITNTIYFKGLWEYPFELENTYDGDFVVNPTNTVTVPMMTYDHKMNLNYTSTDQMQMLQMPYNGNSFSMLIILPHDAVNMQSVEDSLTLDNLELWKSQLGDLRGINIHIPKFTLDTEYNLKKILPDMGVSLVFGPADLSGITGYRGLFVSEAVHKAFVEVNELGTEAAAATAIVMNESGGPLFKADHPFIFLIQDNITNDILFIGKIVDPTK